MQKGGFDYEEHTRKIIEERDQYIEETVAKITDEADRDEFMRALRDAQNTYPFNEDHNFYVEQWTYSELRFAIQECGRRLLKFGIIAGDDPDDVFFLTIAELENIMDELVRDEFMGATEHSRRIPSLIAKRKQTWLDLHKVDPPTFIGTIPEGRVDDPVFIKIWGFTNEVIKGEAKSEEDIEGQVEGMPGAPGIIDGIARVIFGYEGFSEVQPDDVLVAPFTTPAWTPLFSKIKGVVTDSGGMLAHAAICAREYDIPAGGRHGHPGQEGHPDHQDGRPHPGQRHRGPRPDPEELEQRRTPPAGDRPEEARCRSAATSRTSTCARWKTCPRSGASAPAWARCGARACGSRPVSPSRSRPTATS